MNRDYTPLLSGAINKHMVKLALPVLIAMSFQTIYTLVDLYFVGKLGGKAVAGLVISLNAFFVMLTIAHAIGVGGLALISQAWGRKEPEKAREIFAQIVGISLLVGTILFATAWTFTEPYVRFFSSDAETVALGAGYFKIYSATFLFQLFLMVSGFCFRGSGDFVTPMKIMLMSVSLNLIFDPLLIFGVGFFPQMGLEGAALSSVLSTAAGMLVYVFLISKRKKNLYFPCSLKPKLDVIKRVLDIGVPSGCQYAVLAIMMAVTYRWVKPLGPLTTASVGVGFRLLQASYLPMIAFAVATSTMVGQNWGAQLFSRVRISLKWGYIFTNAWAFTITSLFLFFPTTFIGLFTRDAEVIQGGVRYLQIFGLSNFMIGSIFVATSACQGLGKTKPPLVGALAKLMVFVVIWQIFSTSTDLRIIYGSGVIALIFELIWDIVMVRVLIRTPKEASNFQSSGVKLSA